MTISDSLKKFWGSIGGDKEPWNNVGSLVAQSITKPKVTTTSSSAKLRELKSLYNQTLSDYQNSVFAGLDGSRLVEGLIRESIQKSSQTANLGLVEPFYDAILDLATE